MRLADDLNFRIKTFFATFVLSPMKRIFACSQSLISAYLYFAAKLLPDFYSELHFFFCFCVHTFFFTSKGFLLEHTVTERKSCFFFKVKCGISLFNSIELPIDKLILFRFASPMSISETFVPHTQYCTIQIIMCCCRSFLFLSVFLYFFSFCGHCSKRRKVFLSKQI